MSTEPRGCGLCWHSKGGEWLAGHGLAKLGTCLVLGLLWLSVVPAGQAAETETNTTCNSRSITFPRPAGPKWSRGLPIYQIATRYYNKTGGFKEIERDIPRLKSLHVGIIYLMPVHPCSDDMSRDAQMRGNNYQTADFRGVNPAMGSLQDYKDLVRALHANGMYVIQDMVPRHMHPANNMLKLHPDWAKGQSWGLPAWDYDNPDARQYMLESLKYWIREVDIDGYRIDVAGMDPLPKVFQEFIPELRSIKPIFMLAEAEFRGHNTYFGSLGGFLVEFIPS
jgi:glycosidase